MKFSLCLCVSALALSALSACTPEAPGEPPAAAAEAPAAPVVESKFAENDGVKIHYAASGEGPLVVMIHGFPDYHGSWNGLAAALNSNYRVAAMDTRGYNLSSQPEGVENYAMDKLVGDVAAVIAAEGRQTATVIGHDWGAAIAWDFAFSNPDKLDNLVILSVPHPTAFAKELKNNPVQRRNSEYARNFQKEGSEASLTAEGLAGWVQDPEAKARYVEAFSKSSFPAMMNYYRANYPDPNAPAAELPPLNAPLLVIHGMKDQALLASGHSGTWDYVARDSTLLMVPEAGHFVQHDAADLVNGTIRNWLDMRRPQ